MQLRYVFTELGNGLRRNLSMHIAVVLTLFVSLTLVGLGVLLNQEAAKVADRWGSQLQVAVYLCSRHDGNPACTGEVTTAQKQQIQEVVDSNSQVASSYTESKDDAFQKLNDQFPGKYDGPNSPITSVPTRRILRWRSAPRRSGGPGTSCENENPVSTTRSSRYIAFP